MPFDFNPKIAADIIDCINGHSFKEIQDTAYFFDDHHMNEEGARVYSTWLRSQLSNRP